MVILSIDADGENKKINFRPDAIDRMPKLVHQPEISDNQDILLNTFSSKCLITVGFCSICLIIAFSAFASVITMRYFIRIKNDHNSKENIDLFTDSDLFANKSERNLFNNNLNKKFQTNGLQESDKSNFKIIINKSF